MKIGMNLLLWTGHVTGDHWAAIEDIAATGFDGVEVPIFDPSSPAHYRELGRMCDDLGLERTSVAIIPDEAHNPLSPDPAKRAAALDHAKAVSACASELGAELIVGPIYQPLGVFTGEGPNADEKARCTEFHRAFADVLGAAGQRCAIEPLNRFEAYFLNTCEQGVEHMQRVNDPAIGILYDTFHCHIEEKDPLAGLKAVMDAGCLHHVHISENDRGTPGSGHARIRETIAMLKASDYDGWLTIEAFGKAVPELAAATRVWRDFFADPSDVVHEGFAYIRECLAA